MFLQRIQPRILLIFFVLIVGLVPSAIAADRTTIRPGWNLFSPQQDIELGRALKDQVESTMTLVDQNNANAYIDALGKQLSAHAPGERYPWQFKIISDDRINAFSLPGGYVYVTRGLIETASSEPELAGIVAHEIAHVALRHPSQQISSDYASQYPGSNIGRVSVNQTLSRLGVGVDANSVVMRHSPEAERQADIIATQILFDTGFDPREMPQFRQRLNNESASVTQEFFTDHPSSATRTAAVRNEIYKLGNTPRAIRGDSPDFHSVQDHLLAAVDDGVRSNRRTIVREEDRAYGNNALADPSPRTMLYRGRDMEFRHPSNWRVNEESDGGLSVAPDDGFISGSLAYGMRISTFRPRNTRIFGSGSFNSRAPEQFGRTTLSRATDQLIEDLRQSNPDMSVVRTSTHPAIDGEAAMVVELTNDSPTGGRETNRLFTTLRSDGLLYYFVGVAPQRDFNRLSNAFEQIVNSVHWLN